MRKKIIVLSLITAIAITGCGGINNAGGYLQGTGKYTYLLLEHKDML